LSQALGFDFGKQRQRRAADDVLEALTIYRRLYGHLLVPQRFQVPEGSKPNGLTPENAETEMESDWPAHLAGMKLGFHVEHIRNRGRFVWFGFSVFFL
jgi:hypothetical protein